MPAQETLLTTKFYFPPVRTTLVPRPRLVAQLAEGLRRPLTLVCAPAGFGKTTLLGEWHASGAARELPAAWLALDADDNDPARFLTYLIHALRSLQPGLGESALLMLEAAAPPGLQPVLAAVIGELGQPGPAGLLVLDDYHLINSLAVHELITYLLEHQPARLRLAILTRADPPLPLARLRARDQLAEIRVPALRFEPGETAGFLNGAMRLGLSAEDLDSLGARTEGWIAGLQLAALSLRQEPDRHAFVVAFAGDDRYIMDYLLGEVFQHQSPEVQSFLLKTSLLEQLCAPLCEAVTGLPGAGRLLAFLERENLFVVPLDNRRAWYRYHQLFADLLRRRLYQSLPADECRLLSRRGCDWYEAQGNISGAVSQALAAADFEYAAALLERHVLTIFFRSETMRVHRWLSCLPESLLEAYPLLDIVFANTSAHAAGFGPAALQATAARLQAAEQRLAALSVSRPAVAQLARSLLALSKAYLALWLNEPPGTIIALAHQALDGLPPADDQPAPDPNFLRMRSSLNFNLGLSLLRQGCEQQAQQALFAAYTIGTACGDLLNAAAAVANLAGMLRQHGQLREAAALCREALERMGEPGGLAPYAGMIHVSLGQTLLEWNELAEAHTELARGLELCSLIAVSENQLDGLLGLARLRAAQSDYAAAFELLERAAQFSPAGSGPVEAARVRLQLSATAGSGQAPEAALAWAAQCRLEEPDPDWRQLRALTLARVLIRSHRAGCGPDLAELLDFLEKEERFARERGWQQRVIELLLLQALAHVARGERLTGRRTLEQALALAEPGGYVRLFVDEGRPLQALLQELSGSYAHQLLRAMQAPGPASGLAQALSPRELEVLRLLAQGAANAEIARALVISLNTTKKHITHLLAKLEVADRRAAVARARELGLAEGDR